MTNDHIDNNIQFNRIQYVYCIFHNLRHKIRKNLIGAALASEPAKYTYSTKTVHNISINFNAAEWPLNTKPKFGGTRFYRNLYIFSIWKISHKQISFSDHAGTKIRDMSPHVPRMRSAAVCRLTCWVSPRWQAGRRASCARCPSGSCWCVGRFGECRDCAI